MSGLEESEWLPLPNKRIKTRPIVIIGWYDGINEIEAYVIAVTNREDYNELRIC